VSASLDALIEISSGKVNIHVLMAMAAFASIFMGNSLEGGLLLAMFNLAHIAEEYFTSRSMVDVKELKENNPEFALVLDTKDDKLPNTFDLAYKRVPVHDIVVGYNHDCCLVLVFEIFKWLSSGGVGSLTGLSYGLKELEDPGVQTLVKEN
ncbi:putative cadmium/zinc-transporting ATPase HMA1 chloroplastic-like, partial [Trifolium medium]|nr:putative cadmium/zinc-transporting ATPase HMA1 chloroplastic-like [Trifolium medium]